MPCVVCNLCRLWLQSGFTRGAGKINQVESLFLHQSSIEIALGVNVYK